MLKVIRLGREGRLVSGVICPGSLGPEPPAQTPAGAATPRCRAFRFGFSLGCSFYSLGLELVQGVGFRV